MGRQYNLPMASRIAWSSARTSIGSPESENQNFGVFTNPCVYWRSFSSSVYTLHFALCPRDVGAHDSSIWFFWAGVASLWLCCRNWFMESLNQFYKVSIPSSKSISQLKIFLISKYILPGKYIRPWYCVCATF